MAFFDFGKARDKLLALITENKSIREIAQALGTTLGSVSGHLHRNPDLRPSYGRSQGKPKVQTARKSRPARERTPFNDASKLTRQAPKAVVLTEVPVQAEYRVPLRAIAAKGQCRWPVDDDPSTPHGIVCCGAPTAEGSVYCASHHKIAYVKPRPTGRAFALPVRKSNAVTAEKKITKKESA